MTETLEVALVVFGRLCESAAAELMTQEGSEGQCGLVSYSFLHLLDGLGIQAINVQLWRDGEPHVVTLIEGTTVDWTARQFDPEAQFPTVRPVVDLMRDGWQIIGQQRYEGGAA